MPTKNTKRRPKAAPSTFTPDTRATRAAMLDRLADQQLQAGHHHQAERLAFLAAGLREAAR